MHRRAGSPGVMTWAAGCGSTPRPRPTAPVEKACMTLGLGRASLVRIPANERFEMLPGALAAAIAADRAAGLRPIAIVATIGTTSSTSVDPVAAIAEIAEREGLWLHVDAAYAGVVAILPDRRAPFAGWERADSIVVNPHKWLFTPLDASLLLTRRMEVLRAAFSLVPEYLRTLDRADAGPRLQRVHAAARAAVPGAQAVDPAALVRPRGAAPADRAPPRAGRRPRRGDRRGPGLGAAGARSVLDRLLPLAAGRGRRPGRRAGDRRAPGRGERRDHGRRQPDRRGLPVAYPAGRSVHDPRGRRQPADRGAPRRASLGAPAQRRPPSQAVQRECQCVETAPVPGGLPRRRRSHDRARQRGLHRGVRTGLHRPAGTRGAARPAAGRVRADGPRLSRRQAARLPDRDARRRAPPGGRGPSRSGDRRDLRRDHAPPAGRSRGGGSSR